MIKDNGGSLPSGDGVGDKEFNEASGGGAESPSHVVIQVEQEDGDGPPEADTKCGCKEAYSKIKKRMISATPCLQLIGAVGTVVGGLYEAILGCF